MKVIKILLMLTLSTAFVGCSFNGGKEIKVEESQKEEASISEIKNEEVINKSDFDSVIEKTKKEQAAAFTELAYVSENKVVINGDISLMVYDLKEEKITKALDTQSIGMNRIHDIGEDSLSRADYKTFNDDYEYYRYKYEEINYYDNEYTNKYKDYSLCDYRYMDENNICFLLCPKELQRKGGLAEFKLLLVNKETNEEKLYSIAL